jgi:hypothetical protein
MSGRSLAGGRELPAIAATFNQGQREVDAAPHTAPLGPAGDTSAAKSPWLRTALAVCGEARLSARRVDRLWSASPSHPARRISVRRLGRAANAPGGDRALNELLYRALRRSNQV